MVFWSILLRYDQDLKTTHTLEYLEFCNILDRKLDVVYAVTNVKQAWNIFGCLPMCCLRDVGAIRHSRCPFLNANCFDRLPPVKCYDYTMISLSLNMTYWQQLVHDPCCVMVLATTFVTIQKIAFMGRCCCVSSVEGLWLSNSCSIKCKGQILLWF